MQHILVLRPIIIEPTTAPGIESKPPITTAGSALNAEPNKT